MNEKPKRVYGFDISWSRIKYARKFANSKNVNDIIFTISLV